MSTWILLRGLSREIRHWGRLPGLLQGAVNDVPWQTGAPARLLLLDLPGNGEFAHLRAPSTVCAKAGLNRSISI